jgi:hypothetical protein
LDEEGRKPDPKAVEISELYTGLEKVLLESNAQFGRGNEPANTFSVLVENIANDTPIARA